MTDYPFRVSTDDPFHIKQKLKDRHKGVQVIDLSRGEPINPPDIDADEVFAGFLLESVEVSRLLGDVTLKVASPEHLTVAKRRLGDRMPESALSGMDWTVKELVRLDRDKLGPAESDPVPGEFEMAREILSGVRGEDYTAEEGERPVRAVVADKLQEEIVAPEGVQFRSGEVILTIGGSEAIGAMTELLLCVDYLRPGDRSVAMISPLYTPYKFMLEKAGVGLHCIPSPQSNGFEPTVQDLDRFQEVANGIKLLIVVNPGNPSGRRLSSKVLRRLADICCRNDIIILTDVVYAPFLLEPMESLLTYAPENTILVGSGSKFYQETGTRFGFLLAIEAAEKKVASLIGLEALESYYGTSSLRQAFVMAKGPDPVGTFYHTHFVPTPIQWMGAFRMLHGYPDAEVFARKLWRRWRAFYDGLALQSPAQLFGEENFVPYYALIDMRDICASNGYDNVKTAMDKEKVTPEEMIDRLYAEGRVLAMAAATFFPEAPEKNVWKIRFSVANQVERAVKDAADQIIAMLRTWNRQLG